MINCQQIFNCNRKTFPRSDQFEALQEEQMIINIKWSTGSKMMQIFNCNCSDQFEALQEELDRRRQECLQLKVFPYLLHFTYYYCTVRKKHPWYFQYWRKKSISQMSTKQHLNSGGFGKCAAGGWCRATFSAWGGARGRGAAPGLWNSKEGKYIHNIVCCIHNTSLVYQKLLLNWMFDLVASFNFGNSGPNLITFHPHSHKSKHCSIYLMIKSCRLSSSCRPHYQEKGRRQRRWRRSSGQRLRRWLLINFNWIII